MAKGPLWGPVADITAVHREVRYMPEADILPGSPRGTSRSFLLKLEALVLTEYIQ